MVVLFFGLNGGLGYEVKGFDKVFEDKGFLKCGLVIG